MRTGILFCIFFLLISEKGNAWGFYAHQQINQLAVYSLPTELFPFFRGQIEYLRKHAVDPDMRRYLVEGEACRHYIDIDVFEKVIPLDTLPRKYSDAMAKFGEDSLLANGIVPWHIQWVLNRLAKAFEENNWEKVVHIAAELGHYVADAHVPLHNTVNYNGQLTGQHGIHGFFESRLPELFMPRYDLIAEEAIYLDKPLDYIWDRIEQGFSALDTVFMSELDMRRTWNDSKKTSLEERNGKLVKVWSLEYASAWHKKLNGLVERRLRGSVEAVACFWYTAWVLGGQPILPGKVAVAEPEAEKQAVPLQTEKSTRKEDHGPE